MDKIKVKEAIDALKAVHDMYDVMAGDWSFCYTAIEALEKQTPEEVRNTYVSEVGFLWGECPECGKKIAYVQDRNFCSNCSQALDWSNAND